MKFRHRPAVRWNAVYVEPAAFIDLDQAVIEVVVQPDAAYVDQAVIEVFLTGDTASTALLAQAVIEVVIA